MGRRQSNTATACILLPRYYLVLCTQLGFVSCRVFSWPAKLCAKDTQISGWTLKNIIDALRQRSPRAWFAAGEETLYSPRAVLSGFTYNILPVVLILSSGGTASKGGSGLGESPTASPIPFFPMMLALLHRTDSSVSAFHGESKINQFPSMINGRRQNLRPLDLLVDRRLKRRHITGVRRCRLHTC
jgi:hypothetical protein